MKKENSINKKSLKLGGYSIAVTAVVIAIVILLNLAVTKLPSKFTKFSTSQAGLYDISETSRDIMSRVEDKITVYMVAEPDYLDSIVEEYVKKYSELNSKVSYSTVDPAIKPGFVSQYIDMQLNSKSTNLILVNHVNGRSRVITYDELFPVRYTQEELYYYQMTGVPPKGTTYFNAEQSLTSAIDYLTMKKLPTVYFTSGHGEIQLDQKMTEFLKHENIDYKELKASDTSIPDDADVVLINAATKDITEKEKEALLDYIARGGNVLMTSYYNKKPESRNLKNLYEFTKSMGLEYHDVFVLEGSKDNCLSGYGPSFILPQIIKNDFSDSIPANTKILMYNCNSIRFSEDKPDGVTLSELLTTTVKGYAKDKKDENTKTEKEDGDVEGKYILGAMSEKQSGNTKSNLVWFASPVIAESGTAGSFSNVSYFISVLTKLCDKEDSVTIDTKSLQIESLAVTESSANGWGAFFIGAVPLAIIAIGLVVWKHRVKR